MGCVRSLIACSTQNCLSPRIQCAQRLIHSVLRSAHSKINFVSIHSGLVAFPPSRHRNSARHVLGSAAIRASAFASSVSLPQSGGFASIRSSECDYTHTNTHAPTAISFRNCNFVFNRLVALALHTAPDDEKNVSFVFRRHHRPRRSAPPLPINK